MAKQHMGFPGMGGNMQQLLRQAQKAQQDVERIQAEMGEKEFEVSVGGGAVKAVVTGGKVFKSITIDPSCVDPEDVESLQDLVLAAVNESLDTAEKAMNEALGKVTNGLNIPGM